MMTVEDAVEWCAERGASVMFRPGGFVLVVIHGTPIKAEQKSLPASVEDASSRLARYYVAERQLVEERRHRAKTLGAK